MLGTCFAMQFFVSLLVMKWLHVTSAERTRKYREKSNQIKRDKLKERDRLKHKTERKEIVKTGLFPAISGIEPWPKSEIIDLTSKLGEINAIEHNTGSKIYPQNQVILDCIMSSIPLKHKCLSIILIWVIVSHK